MALVVLVHCKAAQERLIRFLPNMIAKDTSLGAFVKDSQIKKNAVGRVYSDVESWALTLTPLTASPPTRTAIERPSKSRADPDKWFRSCQALQQQTVNTQKNNAQETADTNSAHAGGSTRVRGCERATESRCRVFDHIAFRNSKHGL